MRLGSSFVGGPLVVVVVVLMPFVAMISGVTRGTVVAAFVPRVTRPRSAATPLAGTFFTDLAKSFSTVAPSKSKYFTVGITGSGGLIGSALRDELDKKGSINGKPVRVVRLSRGAQAEKSKDLSDGNDESVISLTWNPKADDPSEVLDTAALKYMDTIIHLSGENISTGLSGPLAPLGIQAWSDAKKKEILDSRTITTSALAKAIAASKAKTSFLVASGIGAYGSNFIGPDAPAADESSSIDESKDFLAEVTRQWEAASAPAAAAGSRVVNMRNGVVLSKNGGAMAKLYPIFFLGGGGIVGSGQQYFPFISARDMVRAIVHIMETPTLKGPVNICAPETCTNADFTSAMGKVMGRPTILPFPAFAVSLLFGQMGEEVLLGGTRALPAKLLNSGFKFQHPTVVEAVQSAVDETI